MRSPNVCENSLLRKVIGIKWDKLLQVFCFLLNPWHAPLQYVILHAIIIHFCFHFISAH